MTPTAPSTDLAPVTFTELRMLATDRLRMVEDRDETIAHHVAAEAEWKAENARLVAANAGAERREADHVAARKRNAEEIQRLKAEVERLTSSLGSAVYQAVRRTLGAAEGEDLIDAAKRVVKERDEWKARAEVAEESERHGVDEAGIYKRRTSALDAENLALRSPAPPPSTPEVPRVPALEWGENGRGGVGVSGRGGLMAWTARDGSWSIEMRGQATDEPTARRTVEALHTRLSQPAPVVEGLDAEYLAGFDDGWLNSHESPLSAARWDHFVRRTAVRATLAPRPAPVAVDRPDIERAVDVFGEASFNEAHCGDATYTHAIGPQRFRLPDERRRLLDAIARLTAAGSAPTATSACVVCGKPAGHATTGFAAGDVPVRLEHCGSSECWSRVHAAIDAIRGEASLHTIARAAPPAPLTARERDARAACLAWLWSCDHHGEGGMLTQRTALDALRAWLGPVPKWPQCRVCWGPIDGVRACMTGRPHSTDADNRALSATPPTEAATVDRCRQDPKCNTPRCAIHGIASDWGAEVGKPGGWWCPIGAMHVEPYEVMAPTVEPTPIVSSVTGRETAPGRYDTAGRPVEESLPLRVPPPTTAPPPATAPEVSKARSPLPVGWTVDLDADGYEIATHRDGERKLGQAWIDPAGLGISGDRHVPLAVIDYLRGAEPSKPPPSGGGGWDPGRAIVDYLAKHGAKGEWFDGWDDADPEVRADLSAAAAHVAALVRPRAVDPARLMAAYDANLEAIGEDRDREEPIYTNVLGVTDEEDLDCLRRALATVGVDALTPLTVEALAEAIAKRCGPGAIVTDGDRRTAREMWPHLTAAGRVGVDGGGR